MKIYPALWILLVHLSMEVWCSDFPHEMSLHADYKMWWKFNDEDITVKVEVKTAGWFGWGVGSKGKMRGADMVIGWVDGEGTNHFHDRHGTGNVQPKIDQRQNYKLIEMKEENGYTICTFKRKLVLPDSEDFTITTDTVRVLWALNGNDPVGDNGAMYHGANRGSRSVYLMDYGDRRNQVLPKTYKTFDVAMNKLNVPNRDTAYMCRIIKMPDMGSKKQHLVRIDPIVEKGNEAYVHHMLLYECHGNLNQLPLQGSCRVKNMPDAKCTDILLHGWAVGAGTFDFPQNAGIPLNTPESAKYVLIEIHYDNPQKRRDILDSSGMRMYHTEELRKYDAGFVSFGTNPGQRYSQIIPQQQEEFTSYGFCPAKCLDKSLSALAETPKVFASTLHTHIHGKKVVVRFMNETTGKEILTADKDLNYDFNFQEVRYLKKEIELVPGTRIDLECTLQTMDLQKPLTNGLGTKEEMCLAFMLVYPRISLTTCTSTSLSAWSFGQKLGWNVHPTQGHLISPVKANGKTYGKNEQAYEPLLDAKFWKGNQTRVREFEKLGEKEAFTYGCAYGGKYDGGFALNKPRVLLDESKSASSVSTADISTFLIALVFGLFAHM